MIPAISGAVGPLGVSEWSMPAIDPAGVTQSAPTASGGAGGSFGGILSNAINSLEQSQAAGTTAAQQLATGQLTDPTQAITAIENASLEMQFASQVRTKLDDVATNIFQTQA